MFITKLFFGIPLLAGCLAATGDIEGPFFPPPADGTFTYSAAGIDCSRTGGQLYTFAGHDRIEIARGLYYGKWSDATYATSMDGPIDPVEDMAFTGISGSGSNIAVWEGESRVYVFNGSTYSPIAVTTRFTMTINDLAGAPIPYALPASIDGDFPIGADAVIRVTDDFTAFWLLEALYDGTWTPMNTLYDALQTPPPGHPAHGTEYLLGTGYYTGDLCPVDSVEPFGVLDLADIVSFVNNFTGGLPAADLAAPFGVYDLDDIVVFVTLFQSGCP